MSKPSHPPRARRVLIIFVELFLILNLYLLLRDTIALSFSAFLLIAFVLFWFLNFFLSHIQFGPSVQETLFFKMLPRMQFSSDLFGILIALAIVFGFFFAKLLGSAFLVYLIIVLLGVFAVRLIYFRKNLLRTSWGLAVVGFLFGIAIGNRYANDLIILILFLIGGLFLYLGHHPGEI